MVGYLNLHCKVPATFRSILRSNALNSCTTFFLPFKNAAHLLSTRIRARKSAIAFGPPTDIPRT